MEDLSGFYKPIAMGRGWLGKSQGHSPSYKLVNQTYTRRTQLSTIAIEEDVYALYGQSTCAVACIYNLI